MDTPADDLIKVTQYRQTWIEGGKTTHSQYRGQQETWIRTKTLGEGSFGSVWLEEREDGFGSRAVKRVRKRGAVIDYGKEIVAMAKVRGFEQFFAYFIGWFADDEAIYLAMDYFPLGDLSHYLDHRFAEDDVQDVTRQLLGGLQAMHSLGFAHRDLKPQNVFVMAKTPKWDVRIGDFGISKRIQGNDTELRTWIGTQTYMAPEMFPYLVDDEISHSYTNSVDIWALGVLVFQMFTLRTPFGSHNPLPKYFKGMSEFPEAPLLSAGISADALDSVKALLQLQPANRPTATGALGHRWLSDSVVRSTSTPTTENAPLATGWSLPSPQSTSIEATKVHTVVRKPVGTSKYNTTKVHASRQDSTEAPSTATAQTSELSARLRDDVSVEDSQHLDESTVIPARNSVTTHAESEGNETAPPTHPQHTNGLSQKEGQVSPTARIVPIVFGQQLTDNQTNDQPTEHAEHDRLKRTTTDESSRSSITATPSASHEVSDRHDLASALGLEKDSFWISRTGSGGRHYYFNNLTGESTTELPPHLQTSQRVTSQTEPSNTMQPPPLPKRPKPANRTNTEESIEGTTLHEATLKPTRSHTSIPESTTDDVDWSRTKEFHGHEKKCLSVAFSPDGQLLASGSDDDTVRIWNLQGEEIKRIQHSNDVLTVAFSPDSQKVAAGLFDNNIRVSNVNDPNAMTFRQGGNTEFTGIIRSVKFSPDGRFVVSGSDDKAVRIWDLETGMEVQRLKGHTRSIYGVSFSPDGKLIASGAHDKTIRLWDAAKGVEVQLLRGHTDWVNAVAFSRDGRYLVSGSSDNTVRLWDTASWAEVRCLAGHGSWVRAVAFSSDSRTVISGSDDKSVRIWDVENGWEIQRLAGLTSKVFGVAISPNGRIIAAASKENAVRLWGDVGEDAGNANVGQAVADAQDLSKRVRGWFS